MLLDKVPAFAGSTIIAGELTRLARADVTIGPGGVRIGHDRDRYRDRDRHRDCYWDRDRQGERHHDRDRY